MVENFFGLSVFDLNIYPERKKCILNINRFFVGEMLHDSFETTVKRGYNELVYNELGYNEHLLILNKPGYNEQNPVITNKLRQKLQFLWS